MFLTLLKGIGVGLIISIPVGPVGLLCLERTASYGWRAGLTSTLSMNVADVLSACLMLLFMTLIKDFTDAHGWVINIVSGCVIAFIGAHLIVKRKEALKPFTPAQLAASGATAFLLSISPATFALLLTLFTKWNITADSGTLTTLVGVFVGSAIWGVVILLGGYHLGNLLQSHFDRFKLVAGLIFVCFGLYCGLSQFVFT